MLEVKLHGAQSQGRGVNSPLVMLNVPPKLPASAECNYIQCEGKIEREKRHRLDKLEKQSVVVCAEQKLGESRRNAENHRNGIRSESQRNGTRSQLVRRSDGLIMVDAEPQDRLEASVSQDQTLPNGTMDQRKSPICAMGVEVKQSETSVSSQTRSSSLTGSDKENFPVHRDRQTGREELRLGRRSHKVRRSRRRGSRVDEPHSRSRGCSRESRSSKTEKGSGRRRSRELVSGVEERREGTPQSGRSSKRRHSHDKKAKALKKARVEPAEAAGDIEKSRRGSLSEVRQLSTMSSPVGVEKEGCAEVYSDVSDGDAYREESGKDPRQEGHGEECVGSSTTPGHEEWRWSTSREDLDCEAVTAGDHPPNHDIEAISESDSEAEPCTPMELTIVIEPESGSDVSEVTEGLTTAIPSDIAPPPMPQDRKLATMLPQDSIGSEAAVDVGALTSPDTEFLSLLSPLQETNSGKCPSVLNDDEKILNREDQSSTGDDGSTAVESTERTSFSLESLPEISVHLRSPRPLSQESDSSDDIFVISPFPFEDIIPLSPLPLSPSPLPQPLDFPPGSTVPRANSPFQEHDTSHDYSASMVPHDSLLPYCNGSLSPHTSSTATGEKGISEDDGKTLSVIELNDRTIHSCRSSKEPSPCNSSRPPSTGSHSCRSSKEPSPCNSSRPPSTAVSSAGSEIEEGELISEDEDNASITSSSTCSKTSTNSAPPMQASNRRCKPLKASRKTERSYNRNVSSKEPAGQNHYQPSSERTVVGTLRSHKKDCRRQSPLRKPTCRSHDSECHRSRRLSDLEGYRLQRSRDSKGRSHDLERYRTRKSHDLHVDGYRSQRSHDPECHRAPIGHRREMLHSDLDHHLPHARVHDYNPKPLRRPRY